MSSSATGSSMHRLLLLTCLSISPLAVQQGRTCMCFSVPLCNSLPSSDGTRTIFVGTVVDVFPASIGFYKRIEADLYKNDRGSIARTKALMLRLWGPVLSSNETRAIRLADSEATLRGASEIGIYARRVRFRVQEGLEGHAAKEFELFTEATSCGYRFAMGKNYLVVSHRSSKTNRWWTGACSRTAPVDLVDAQEDIKALRASRDGRPLAPRIYGRILDWRNLPPGDPGTSGLRGAVVRLVGASFEEKVTSGAQGRFAFENLAPAQYRIDLLEPAVLGSAREIDLARGRCFEAEVFIEQDEGGTKYQILGSPVLPNEAAPPKVLLEPPPNLVLSINVSSIAPLLLPRAPLPSSPLPQRLR